MRRYGRQDMAEMTSTRDAHVVDSYVAEGPVKPIIKKPATDNTRSRLKLNYMLK